MLAAGSFKAGSCGLNANSLPVAFPNPEIHVGYSFSACFLLVSARFGTIWKQLESILEEF